MSNNPFFLSNEERLYFPWRIIGLFLLIKLFSFSILFALVNINFQAQEYPQLYLAIGITLLSTTFSVFIARRYLDKRSFVSLGLTRSKYASLDYLFGFLLSGLMIALIYFFGLLTGLLHFCGFIWEDISASSFIFQTLLGLLTIGITVSWTEEIVYRGYLLQNLQDNLGSFWAVLISSGMFTFVHLDNPNINLIGILGLFLGGICLSYGRICTKQLFLPLGFHCGWNFFEAIVFGFPVSGINTFHLISHQSSAPTWIIGGEFGPEGGLVMLMAMLFSLVCIHYWERLREGRSVGIE